MSHMKDSVRRIWQYVKPYKTGFLSAIALTIVCMIVNALQPYIIGLAMTELANNVADMLK